MTRIGLVAASVLIAGLISGSIGRWSAQPDRGLFVQLPVQEIGIQDVNRRIHLSIPVLNQAKRPLRILGFSGGCSPTYCIYATQNEVTTVAPGAECQFPVEIMLRGKGPFDALGEIYLEASSGVEAVLVGAKGVARNEGERQ